MDDYGSANYHPLKQPFGMIDGVDRRRDTQRRQQIAALQYEILIGGRPVHSLLVDEPIAVAAKVRPPWLAAVADEVGVASATLDEALATFAAV